MHNKEICREKRNIYIIQVNHLSMLMGENVSIQYKKE